MPVTYNPKTNRYRAPNGRFISTKNIRDGLEKSVEVVRLDMKAIAKQLEEGKINLPEFQIQMRDVLKAAHSISASIGRGGRAQMTLSDWATVGNDLKKQYKYLNRFALGIENGTITPAQIESRAAAYANSIHPPFYAQSVQSEKRTGKTEARRVLHAKESCSQCAANTGWMPIDKIPPIGSLLCGSHCKCTVEFK